MLRLHSRRTGRTDELFPPGLIKFDAASATAVIDIYKELSGAELLVASNVNTVAATVTYKSTVPLTRVQALKALEQAILEQAGVVITKLDQKRASVTYNDALPLKLAPGAKPPPAGGRSSAVLTAPDGKTYVLAPDGRRLVPISPPPIPPPVPPPLREIK